MLGLHGALRIRTDGRRRFDEARQHLALDDDRDRPQLIETIFVPRGAEERAVRRGLRRARSPMRVVAHGIGPRAAARAADAALGDGAFGEALSTGLCGLLSPSLIVGDVLVYDACVRDGATLCVDASLAARIAQCVPGSQAGIRSVASDTIVLRAADKRDAAARFDAQAVDMESCTLAERLQRAGVSVAIMRVAGDGAGDDLPRLDRALDGSGGIDGFALALAFAREPLLALTLVRNAMRALRALEDAVFAIARAA